MTLSDDPEELFQGPQENMADANTQAIIDAVTTGIMQLQNAITIDGLAARGEIMSDLLVNLFKGYKMVKDKLFLDYLQTIENGHEDGSAVVDALHLMLHAVNFYKNWLTCKQWEQKSQQERDVLALEAKENNFRKMYNVKQNRYKFNLQNQWAKEKKDQKPVKPDWLAKHTLPKPDAIK